MMLLILYIVQAICNQALPPRTPTQLEQILLVFCFYLKYILKLEQILLVFCFYLKYISYSNIFLDIFLMFK
jgi:hypothetical protein